MLQSQQLHLILYSGNRGIGCHEHMSGVPFRAFVPLEVPFVHHGHIAVEPDGDHIARVLFYQFLKTGSVAVLEVVVENDRLPFIKQLGRSIQHDVHCIDIQTDLLLIGSEPDGIEKMLLDIVLGNYRKRQLSGDPG